MMKDDIIRITSYSAEEANDSKSLALGDDPNIMKEFGIPCSAKWAPGVTSDPMGPRV
jgi:hypothetical protein